MKALRTLVDKIKPTFTRGGKLGFLASTFGAFETFLFVPNHTTKTGAHIRDCNDMKRTMIVVVLALLPAMLFGCYNTGLQVGLEGLTAFVYGLVRFLPMLATSYIVGLGIEFVAAQLRGHEVNEGFLVSGFIIPLVMPVSTPLWMIAVGTAFAVIFGKEVFGGTGMNVFNPAVLARAFVFFAYTPQMSGETVWYSTWKMFGATDAATGATALEQLASQGGMQWSALDAFLGFIPGSFGETSTAAILIGAAVLLFTGIASSWQVGLFAIGTFLAFIFVRPFVLKLMDKKANKSVTTNMDNLIGRKAVVTEKIEKDGYGRVKIDGDDWKARMEDDSEAEVGEKVTILSNESIILTVKK